MGNDMPVHDRGSQFGTRANPNVARGTDAPTADRRKRVVPDAERPQMGDTAKRCHQKNVGHRTLNPH